MNVQQIEFGFFRDFEHFHCKGQRVRLFIEQRIAGDLDLVKKDVLACSVQPDGHRVADEMDVVPTRRELDSQLRGNHAGAAVCWITCDSNFHGPLTLSSLLVGSNCRC